MSKPAPTVSRNARPHSKGTRSLGSGSRSLWGPSEDRIPSIQTVHTSVDGDLVSVTLSTHRPFLDGLVLIARHHKGRIRRGNVLVRDRALAKTLGVPEAYKVFIGLRDAIRAYNVHVQDGYVAEAELLSMLTSEDVPKAMARTMELAGITAVQKRQWTRFMLDLVEELKYDRDEGKAEARDKLLRAADIHDVLGRPNPSAARARIMAALSRLRDREAEVPGLNAHRARIAAQLKVIDLSMMAMVLNLELEVKRAILRVHEAMGGKDINLVALAQCLANEARHFASKDANPYGPHAFMHYAKDLSIVATALRAKRPNLKKAAERLDVLARSILLQREHGAVDAALTAVSRIQHAKGEFLTSDANVISDLITSVRNFLTTHLDIDVGFRQPVAADLRSALAHAQKAIDHDDLYGLKEMLESAARCF